MLTELFEDYQKNLNFFFDQVSIKKAQEVLCLFLHCKGTLIFTGVGKSGIIAEKLAMTLISIGTKALFLPPLNALHGDIGVIAPGDLLICVSKSGESEELLDLLPFVHQRGAKTIAWVSNAQSKLFKQCDLGIHLPFERELCPFGLAPTTSTAVQLIFGDVLSVALMKTKELSLDEYALNHPAGNIGKKTTLRVNDLMLKGDKLPLCRSDDQLRDVLVELTSKQCGSVVIVDEHEEMRGIFTDGDLRRALQKNPQGVLDKKMGELMTCSFFFTESGLLAWDALRLMQKDPKRWVMILPVLERQRIVGLLRMHDIVQAGIS